MREYYRDRLEKALKNFLWSPHLQPNRLCCGIKCRFLSRLEGLYPEIALKNPQKSGSWLLRRNHRGLLFFFILDILYLDLNASGWDRVSSVQQFNVHAECLGTSSQPKECTFLREIWVGIDITNNEPGLTWYLKSSLLIVHFFRKLNFLFWWFQVLISCPAHTN